MDNDKLEKWKKSALNGKIISLYPKDLLALIALAERATQPSQRKSQIDIHRITCEEARKIGGGLIDTIPADDVTALGRAIYQRILDSQPAQDQVAAVRAVPEGWKLVPEQATEAMYHAGQDVPEPRTFGAVYSAMLAAAPSPQPELSGNIDTPKADPVVDRWALEKAICAGEVDPEHCVYKRSDVVEIIKLLRTAAPAPQPQPGGGIDTDEFSKLLAEVSMLWLQDPLRYVHAREKLVTHIDAWKYAACAAAAEEARRDVHETNVMCVKQMFKARDRATDAEAKLAAIRAEAQAPVSGIAKAAEDARAVFKDSCNHTHQAIDYMEQVLLAQRTATPSQSDTSGLAV